MTHEIDESDFDPDSVPDAYVESVRRVIEVDDNHAMIPSRRVVFDDGFAWGPPKFVDIDLFHPGEEYVLALAGLTHPRELVGVRRADAHPSSGWLWRLPESAIKTRMNRRLVPNYELDGIDRETLVQYEAELPDWLRNRIEFFRACNPAFQYEHWRLELEVCALTRALLRHFDDYIYIPPKPHQLTRDAVVYAHEALILKEFFDPRSPFSNYWYPGPDTIYAAWILAASKFHDDDFDAAGTFPAFTYNGDHYK